MLSCQTAKIFCPTSAKLQLLGLVYYSDVSNDQIAFELCRICIWEAVAVVTTAPQQTGVGPKSSTRSSRRRRPIDDLRTELSACA